MNNIIIAQFNINSINHKFDKLSFIIQGNVDILLVSATKLNKTFPIDQFHIAGYNQPYRRDGTKCGGGVMVFEDLSSKQFHKHICSDDIEAIVTEIILKQQNSFF